MFKQRSIELGNDCRRKVHVSINLRKEFSRCLRLERGVVWWGMVDSEACRNEIFREFLCVVVVDISFGHSVLVETHRGH